MNGLMQSFLEFVGVTEIPTDFPSFMFFVCTLTATLYFIEMIFRFIGSLNRQVREVSKWSG